MNEDLARIIAAASVGATVFGIGVAVLFSTRESRVRLPMDILMVWITAGALAGVAVVTGVHTDPLIAGGAGVLGFILGTAQGSQLRVRRDGNRVFARRGAIALAAWGAGLITIQAASLANRENLVEIGQAVSYFGVGGAFGLIVGRETAIRRLAPVGTAVLAFVALGLPLLQQRPVVAQDTELIELTPIINSSAILQAFGEAESGLEALGTGSDSTITIQFPSTGGAVTGEGDSRIEDFKLGLLIHAFELLAEGIGETIGGATIGGVIGADGDDPSVQDRPIRSELANCTAIFGMTLRLDGSYDPLTTALSGPATATFYFAEPSNCPADTATGEFSTLTGSWDGTYRDGALDGEVRFADSSTALVFPLEAALEEPEPEPGASTGSTGSENPAASPEDPANTEGEDPEGEDGEIPPPVIAPPVVLEEIEPEEAAGVGLIGAGAAGLVGLVSAASAAASAPTGAPIGVFEQPEAKKPEDDEEGPRERTRDDIDPEDVDQAAENIVRLAGKENYQDILEAVRSRMENGTIDAATLETLRQILKDRMAIDAALASSDLMNKPDWQAFLEGFRSDLARLADHFGMGIVIRDPLLVTRILAAVHTAGASEVVFFPAQVAGALWDRANSPGQDIRTTEDAAMEVATVIGVEAATEAAGELLGAGLIRGGGAAVDALRGAGKGADLTDLARGVRPGSLDEAMEGAARGLPPAGTLDEALEGGARGLPPASSLDEAIEGGARRAALDEAAAGRPPADLRAPIPEEELAPFRPQEMENSPITRTSGPRAPGASPDVPPRGASPRDLEPTVFDPDPLKPPSVVPKQDDTWLKNAPNGTKIPEDQLGATGYTRGQIEDLQDIARRNDVLLGQRATNPAAAHHIENGTAVPKPMPVKQKTTTPTDLLIGGRPENEGLVSVFRPTPPKASDFRNPSDYKQAMERYVSRADEFNRTMKDLDALKRDHGITWDPQTGLLKNADGKPFAGDIDGVYIKDAKTGRVLNPDDLPEKGQTVNRYNRVMAELESSRVQTQHGMESSAVRDIAKLKGPQAIPGAENLHENLSRNHQLGKETLIEVGPDGIQKGPRPFGVYDQLHPEQSSLNRGLPMAIPE